jgi:tRNA(Arg) A34 adenosine deaminase TadA
MLMALLYEYWNGNKKGRSERYEYPWNDFASPGKYLDADYQGHNIGAIAVDSDGRVIDFEFNHNRLFNSSAEHAEARLVRRVFGLAQLSDSWRPAVNGATSSHVPLSDYTMLKGVTIYTSLESCAQCAGVMALGRVRQIVYLQTDPGMYFIGRILRNLTDDKLRAPLPITGAQIGLPHFVELDRAFGAFGGALAEKPFWVERDKDGSVLATDTDSSVTSFLCTQSARAIYEAATAEFKQLVTGERPLEFPAYKPPGEDGSEIATACTNAEVVGEAADFLTYATSSGHRGTPHH